ncbi:uncharacterized protein RAG0_02055 [Rhynchosporium agropyri]|uniref:Uncharacterized protein n=1 Tax=Rhynchosporium agropyri TaxID=914238 RepID=A0A1E1K4D3_9HELO|nr:uncharacterized protein RAG0_02055 [Rhynchosporium agropyri]
MIAVVGTAIVCLIINRLWFARLLLNVVSEWDPGKGVIWWKRDKHDQQDTTMPKHVVVGYGNHICRTHTMTLPSNYTSSTDAYCGVGVRHMTGWMLWL